jgi:urea transport system permease protein
LFGFNLSDPANQKSLYFVVAGTLLGLFLLAHVLIGSRFGRLLLASRDGENRVRFLGYNPLVVKTVAFAFSAALAGIAGALFVPVVGIISPSQVDVGPSLILLIAVAVGGRGTLFGAVIGAVTVNWAQTLLSEHFASGWLYFQGALFILVIAVIPGGLVGVWRRGRDAIEARRGVAEARPEMATPVAPAGELTSVR